VLVHERARRGSHNDLMDLMKYSASHAGGLTKRLRLHKTFARGAITRAEQNAFCRDVCDGDQHIGRIL
jgi:hypothetical protein